MLLFQLMLYMLKFPVLLQLCFHLGTCYALNMLKIVRNIKKTDNYITDAYILQIIHFDLNCQIPNLFVGLRL